jgi:hypothetical protein
MKRLTLYIMLFLFYLPACTENPHLPESVAKNFVNAYFIKKNRGDLAENATGSAVVKLDVENEYSEQLNNPEIEIETPSVIQLTDSIQLDPDRLQYTFSIIYHGNTLRYETMQIVLEKKTNEWKVSDYRFTSTGDL